MEINKKLRAAKYGYMILSVLICILGIILIAVPDFSQKLLCRIGGTLLIIFGCVKILGYLSKDLYRLAFQFDLASGILLIALGLILILRAEAMIHVICVLLGLFILADSLLKIQTAIDAKFFGIRRWWLILAFAIFTAVFGFLLLFQPYEARKTLMILLGIGFLGEGILNLTTVLTAVRILQRKPLQIVESENREEF